MNTKRKYFYTYRFFFWLIVIISAIKPVISQTISSKKFTTENGLSYNYIQHITQDKTGFLWISTWDGLNRYDGYEFRNYYHRPNDSLSFPFFPVDKVLVDSLNNVWILCEGKPIYKYNRANDNFEKFELLKDQRVFDINMDKNGDIWFTNDSKLFHYSTTENCIDTVKVVGINNQESIFFHSTPQLVFDNQNRIWIFDYYPFGIQVYRGVFLNDSVINLYPLNPIMLSNLASYSLKHLQGNFNVYTTCLNETWLFSKYGLFQLDSANHLFALKDTTSNAKLFTGGMDLSWIDEKSGIHVIQSEKGRQFAIPNPQGQYFETVFIDRNRSIWSGSISESRMNIGLFRFNEIPDNFDHYLTNNNEDGNINLIFPIVKDKFGNLWVGSRTTNYLFKIKPDKSVEKIDFLKSFNGVNYPKVRSMTMDSTGIWLGCNDNYIVFYDFKTERFSTLNSLPLNVNNNTSPLSIHNILKRGNELIFSGNEGIYSYSLNDKKLRVEYWFEKKEAIFTMTDDNNNLWLGTFGNTIIHLNSRYQEIGVYKIGTGENIVEHICLGDNNDLWIALMGGGLGHFVPATGETDIFTTADGLANNTIYSILKDERGNLWISTNKGLSQFNPQTRTFRNYGRTEGLQIEEFNSDAFFKAPDGEMFFGGVGGMVGFYPDSIYNSFNIENTGPLVITDFRVSGMERFFNKAIYDLDTVILEKGENNFQITFANIDFLYADKIKYKYRLTEEHENWVETSYQNRNANYSNLIPGTYHLDIQCTNPNGEWTTSKQIVVQIPSFFYQTLLFKLTIIFAFLSLIFFIAGLVIRQIQLKAKQRQNELKLESLRGQMNPHFIFNALNSVNYFISNNDKISANSYIADFSRLIRSILNNLSHDFIPFENELESIRDYLRLEHLRFSDKFTYEIKSEIEKHGKISVFPGLVQPLIENAIWHGVRGLDDKRGFIKVNFITVSPEMIRCIVEDDGVGRKQAEIHKNVLPGKKSRGIGIVSERLKIISEIRKVQYKLTFEDVHPGKLETGTRVTIDLPVQRHNLSNETAKLT